MRLNRTNFFIGIVLFICVDASYSVIAEKWV
jgi:hypothetical protein